MYGISLIYSKGVYLMGRNWDIELSRIEYFARSSRHCFSCWMSVNLPSDVTFSIDLSELLFARISESESMPAIGFDRLTLCWGVLFNKSVWNVVVSRTSSVVNQESENNIRRVFLIMSSQVSPYFPPSGGAYFSPVSLLKIRTIWPWSQTYKHFRVIDSAASRSTHYLDSLV